MLMLMLMLMVMGAFILKFVVRDHHANPRSGGICDYTVHAKALCNSKHPQAVDNCSQDASELFRCLRHAKI